MNRKIGRNRFSEVYEALSKRTNEKVAIRAIEIQGPYSSVKNIKSEFSRWKTIESPYVLRCRELVEIKGVVGIVTDFADGGNLEDFIKKNPDFFATHLIEFVRALFQLVSGLNAIH